MTGRDDQLAVGRTNSGKPFRLPADVVTRTTAVLGIRGSGKTNTAGVITEELLDLDHQVIVVDPLDVWYGLKSTADGKSKGYPIVVLGGTHGDLPLQEEDGATIADFAVEHRTSLILSLRHLRKGAQRRFVTAFAEQLYHRKGETKHRVPLLVAFDEASEFVPQRVGGSEAQMVGAVEDLVRRGRASGIGVALIDQRPASVNKDVLTQLEILVTHQITSPQDSKALDAWVSQHDAENNRDSFMAGLPVLKTGEAWFWAPSLELFERVQVRARKTFDSSKTPKLGEQLRGPERLAEVDLDTLRSKLQATIEEARANDPKVLQKRIAELEREVEALQTDGGFDEAEKLRLQNEVDEAYRRGVRVGDEQLLAAQDKIDRLNSIIGLVKSAVADHTPGLPVKLSADTLPLEDSPAPRPIEQRRAKPIVPPVVTRAQTPRSTSESRAASNGKLSRAERAALDALAFYESIGQATPTKQQVGAAIGVNTKKSTWRGLMAPLRANGYVEDVSDDRLALTAAGRKLATIPERPPTRRDLHARVSSRLSKSAQTVLAELLRIYPRGLSPDAIATLAGTSKEISTYRAFMAELRKDDLVQDRSKDDIAAAEWLMPKGLR